MTDVLVLGYCVAMGEFLPVVLGGMAGLLLTFVFRRPPTWARLAGAGLAGGLATLMSGEWRAGWQFLLVDIPLGTLGGLITGGVTIAVLKRPLTSPT